jgi:glycerol-1-phosphate dehydrogenase [NAD(P)+]
MTFPNLESWKCSCGRHSWPKIEVIVEKGALEKLPEVRRKLGLGGSCLIVDDVNTREVAGASLRRSLQRDDCHVSEVVVGRPDEANVEKVVERVGKGDFLLGVGGTSVLDITKLAAYRTSVRYVIVSTGVANNGMSSKTASISIKGKKETIPVSLADALIVDLAIVSDAPTWMVAAGCGDLVAETTAIKDWQLGRDEQSEPYCNSVAELELSALNDVIANIEMIKSRNDAGIRILVNALIRSGLGMTIWGSSRPASGSEHLWSHWLDHYADENKIRFGQHGEQVGIGTCLMAKYHELYDQNWWSCTQHPVYQAEALMSFLKGAGAPATPSEIGIERRLAIQAFLDAWEYRKERYTILHKRHPSRQDADRILRQLSM